MLFQVITLSRSSSLLNKSCITRKSIFRRKQLTSSPGYFCYARNFLGFLHDYTSPVSTAFPQTDISDLFHSRLLMKNRDHSRQVGQEMK